MYVFLIFSALSNFENHLVFSCEFCEISKNSFLTEHIRATASVWYNVNHMIINPLSAKFIKWSNTLKQIVGKLPTICLSMFDHFSGLAFKGLTLTTSEKEVMLPETFSFCFINVANRNHGAAYTSMLKRFTDISM